MTMTIEILAERIEALEKQIMMLTKSSKVKTQKVKGSRMSGYILYSKDARDKVVADLSAKSDEKVKSSEIMKELGARWKALGDDDKETWNTKAKEMKDVVADNVVVAAKEEVQQEVKAKKAKKSSKNADSDDEKPKTKRISGYIIFSKAMREEAKATLA